MWRRISVIMRKELIQVLRDPRLRVLLFGPPLVQLIIFGYAVNLDGSLLVNFRDFALLGADWLESDSPDLGWPYPYPWPPYDGKLKALTSDFLLHSPSNSTANFPHYGEGYNVLFTDFHAKWTTDPQRLIWKLSISSGPNGFDGRNRAWNLLSAKH